MICSLIRGASLAVLFHCVLTILISTNLQAQQVSVSLISEDDTLKVGNEHFIGVYFKIEKDWHLYWKYAGDSGTPPKVKWNVPAGVTVGEILWPYPERIAVGPLVNYGYEDELLLIAKLVVDSDLDITSPLDISAQIKWLVCKEDCYPGEGSASINIPINRDSPIPSNESEIFSKFRSKIPDGSYSVPVSAVREGRSLTLLIDKPKNFAASSSIKFFPTEGGIIENAAIQDLIEDGDKLKLKLKSALNQKSGLDSIEGVLVSSADFEPWSKLTAVEIKAPILAFNAILNHRSSLLQEIFFAFLAGLILNIMPCVFPVLSLKALKLVNISGKERTRVRIEGIVYTIGVIMSFLILATLLSVLKGAGQELGWGFQLQSPVFVAAMCALLIAIVLNLSGIFEIGASFQRLAGRVNISKSWVGSFFDGMIAVVLASPCSAPFMGGAIAYALTASIFSSFLIFTGLGLGMALPFLLLSINPSLIDYFPRPGAWMDNFKKIMIFPLLVTVAWLIWVYSYLTDHNQTFVLLLALIGVSFGLFTYGAFSQIARTASRRRVWGIIALLIIIISLIPIVKPKSYYSVNSTAEDSSPWIEFSTLKFEEIASQKRPIFIDFTAAWCITCQVNKRLVLNTETVQKAFRSKGVVLMKADWTRQDDEIGGALRSYGYQSVPLNVLHIPSQSEPIIFPAVLTIDIVLSALEKVK